MMKNKPKYKVLINCSNLHSGGGVAVATSFINAISQSKDSQLNISLLLSPTVKKNIDSLKTETSNFDEVIIKGYYGINSLWTGLGSSFKKFDLVFTVFGPIYSLSNKTPTIVGFAQPYIIYPSNPSSLKLTAAKRIKQRLKYIAQEFFFSRSSEIIVELDHVKKQLENKFFFRNKKIHIINSAVDSVYNKPLKWKKIPFKEDRNLKLGIISRNYPHKNLTCLPLLKIMLFEKFNINVSFYVTFTQNEWDDCSASFQKEIINIGSLTLNQCPSFYKHMDGIIFPSFLECFSAVPIESMMMMKPLFASDLPFIRDCCSDNANYFDPLNIASMAQSINDYYNLPEKIRNEKLNDAYKFVITYPNALQRAEAYLNVLRLSLGINQKEKNT